MEKPLIFRCLRRSIKCFLLWLIYASIMRVATNPGYKKNIDKIELFYLPSYSPDLNPVELLNNDLKIALHKGEPARCKGKLKTKVRRHMMKRQREPHIVKKFFKKPSTAYAEDEDTNV